MAETLNTLAALLQFTDANISDIEVSNLLQETPVLNALHAQAASHGTVHKYLRTTVASSAAFRAINAGVIKTFSQDELKTDTLKLFDAGFHIDKGLMLDGDRAGLMARGLMRSLKSFFAGLEKQFFYGTTALGDSDGWAGLMNSTLLDAIADDMVIQPGTPGATADSQTSVFFIRSAEDSVSMVMGQDGLVEIGDPYETTIHEDSTSDAKLFDAMRIPILGHSGLQTGNNYSAARIANIEGDFDDDDAFEALSLFPSGQMPNICAMNRKALRILRQSRTATNATGAPAPFPTEVGGVPIYVTDSIVSTEPVET